MILSDGTPQLSFVPNTTSYAVGVAYDVSSITVTVTLDNPAASLTVDSTVVTDGPTSGPIGLNVGSNTILIVATAQDGVTTKTYEITVDRASDVWLTSVQTDATGQTVQVTFNQPVDPKSLVPEAFMLNAGGSSIAVTRVAIDTSDNHAVDLTVDGSMYKWDRITMDIQGELSKANSVLHLPELLRPACQTKAPC